MREPERHRLTHHPPEGGAHLEAGDEDAGGDGQGGGQDGEEEGGDDVDCQYDEYVPGPGISPVLDMVVLLHGEVGDVPGPGVVTEQDPDLVVSVHVRRLEGPGPGGEGEAGDEEGDDEWVDEPVLLEEGGQFLVSEDDRMRRGLRAIGICSWGYTHANKKLININLTLFISFRILSTSIPSSP